MRGTMIMHPSFRVISDLADDELPARKAARVREHLAHCSRCRDVLRSIRDIEARTHGAHSPAMANDLLSRITARADSGESVILPADDADDAIAPAHSRRGMRAAVAAGLAAVLAGALWLNTSTLEAEASSLVFSPAAPRAGMKVDVEYHATSRLASQSVLSLRARVRRPNEGPTSTNMMMARLRRTGDRTYKGSFILPDSAVYAVFAVEDTLATTVDVNSELWDVMVHGADGTPIMSALLQRSRDAEWRDTEIAADAVRQMMRLYPNETETLFLSFHQQIADASRAVRDSISRDRIAKLPAYLARLDSTDLETISEVIFYTGAIGAADIQEQWRARLQRLYPNTLDAKWQRAYMAVDQKFDDRAAYWVNLERIWDMDHTGQAQLILNAFRQAYLEKNAEMIERWGERVVTSGSTQIDRSLIIPAYMSTASLRDKGMNHIRAYARELEQRPDTRRHLTRTRTEFRTGLKRDQSVVLAQLGQALAEDGKIVAANDTLALAGESTWSTSLFRTIARTRLAMGDTADALSVYARVAVDPLTPAGFSDSIASAFPRAFDTAKWAAAKDKGAQQLRSYLLQSATMRPARGAFRVLDAAGKSTKIEPTSNGETFIAVWSTHCPPSVMQLAAVEQLTRKLAAQGVRIITIAQEDPADGGVAGFVQAQKLTFPYYYDVDREAHRSLDIPGTPTYMMLDAEGRVRFQSWDMSDVLRQLWFLRQGRAASP